MRIDPASIPTLLRISADFVMVTGDGALRVMDRRSGCWMTREGFVQHCAKEYGGVGIYDPSGNLVSKPSGVIWWDWDDPSKRVVQKLIMRPTADADPQGTGEYNLWYDWKNDMAVPSLSANIESIEILFDHLMYISDNDHEGVLYFLHWLAWLWNHPDTKIPVAIMMYSKHGRVGKSILSKLLSHVFGRKLVKSVEGKVLHKNFMDAVEFKRIMFLNELARQDKQDNYETFKSWISEDTMEFEGKGRASREMDNFVHWIITTNNADCLPLMQGDGRVLVLRTEATRRDNAYYAALAEWIDGPGPELVAGCFYRWVFPDGFDPYAPAPQTRATVLTQHESRGGLACFLEELIAMQRPPFDKDLGRVSSIIEQLDTLYSANMRALKANHKTIPAALQSLGHEHTHVNIVLKNGTRAKVPVWIWRNHNKWIKEKGLAVGEYLSEDES